MKVAVRVQAWENPWDDGDFFAGTPLGSPVRGHWDGHDRPVGFYGPFRDGWSPFRLQGNERSDKAAVASGSAGSESQQPYGAELIPGLLGLTALIGSGLVGYRRRRTS
jgi:hypothetical protein